MFEMLRKVSTNSHKTFQNVQNVEKLPYKHTYTVQFVQTEVHVLCECILVNHIRVQYGCNIINFNEFMNAPKSIQELSMLKDILTYCEHH